MHSKNRMNLERTRPESVNSYTSRVKIQLHQFIQSFLVLSVLNALPLLGTFHEHKLRHDSVIHVSQTDKFKGIPLFQ